MIASASAPASSGNIGPGFDILALALELRCRVQAAPADEWSVSHVTGMAPSDTDEDLVLETARSLSDQPLSLRVSNQIPLGRGLGSSSAARAAAVAATLRAVDGSADPERVFEHVAEVEGHADNAAATVFGGLVGVTAEGRPIQLPLALQWRVVIAIPEASLATKEARSILAPQIDRPTVVRSLGRLVALLEGLRTGDEDALAAARGDELHEGPRAGLNPTAAALIGAACDAGAPHAAWSGAGPSVIAFADGARAGAVAAALGAAMPAGEVRVMDVATRGII